MNKTKIKKYCIAFIILILAGLINELPKYKDYYDGLLHVYFFDVGQGDSILIKTPDRKLILTDGGYNDYVMYRLSDVLPFWVNYIDYVVVSHSHADHIFGLISLVENYGIGCVQYNDISNSISKVEDEFRSILLSNGIFVSNDCIDGKMEYFIPGDVNNPNGLDDSNPNLSSLISIYTYKDFDLLLTGDAEIPEQTVALPRFSKDIEIIKVPHHGSFDSFYRPLLLALKPEAAVISVGKNNSYHLPSKLTLKGYEDLGINVFRTDLDGTIEVVSDGYLWSIVE